MPAQGLVKELILLDGIPTVRIQCDPSWIPAPGQYLHAYADASNSLLADLVFLAKSFADGFLAAPPVPISWTPGTLLHLRGPMGNGFLLPENARKVALITFDIQPAGVGDSPLRLLSLLDTAVGQEASIVLVCHNPPAGLPLQIEVQPLSALLEVFSWADYVAIDVRRESLPGLMKIFGGRDQRMTKNEVQILVRTPMPCGDLAECGICTVESRRGRLLACKQGPVFTLNDFLD